MHIFTSTPEPLMEVSPYSLHVALTRYAAAGIGVSAAKIGARNNVNRFISAGALNATCALRLRSENFIKVGFNYDSAAKACSHRNQREFPLIDNTVTLPRAVDTRLLRIAALQMVAGANLRGTAQEAFHATCALLFLPIYAVQTIFSYFQVAKDCSNWNEEMSRYGSTALINSRNNRAFVTRSTLTRPQNIVRVNHLCATFAATATCGTHPITDFFAKTIFDNFPAAKLRSDGNKGMFGNRISTAVHAYLCRQVFHLALHGYLELCTAYFIASRRMYGTA